MWKCFVPPEKAPALVHLSRLPDAAVEGIPHTPLRVKGRDLMVFRHDLPTWRALRRRGMLAPSPMRYYRWPGPFTPMSHQKATAEFFTLHDKCFCLSGLGTGKTHAAIWAMDYLLQEKAVRRVLVVAPLTLARIVWVRELWRTLPRRKTAFLRGNRKEKQRAAADLNNEILVINPESIHLVTDCLPDVDLVVVDEFTKFKTIGTQRFKALRNITRERKLWMMSATPAPQSPVDAYAPIRLVRGKDFQMTKLDWQRDTMIQVSQWNWMPRRGCEQTIFHHMQPSIRFKQEECYDLKPLLTIPLEIDLTKEQEKAIGVLKREGSVVLNEEVITAVHAGAFFQKAQQLMLGFAYNSQGEPAYIGASPLYDTIKDLIESSPQPVLLFAPFKAAVNRLQADLTKDGFVARKITADVPEKERTPIFDAFQKGEVKVLVAVPGTMSHGLTLTESNVVIWTVAPTSFEIYDQAIGRVARMGQTRQVVNYQLYNHNIGKKLYERLESREKLQDTLLKLYEGRKD